MKDLLALGTCAVTLVTAACGGVPAGLPSDPPLLLPPASASQAAPDPDREAPASDPARARHARRPGGTPPEAGPAAPPPEHSAGALAFGEGTTVDIGPLAMPEDFTLEAWVNPAASAPGGEMEILSKDFSGEPENQFRLGLLATGEAFFMASDASSAPNAFWEETGYGLKSPQPLPLAAWTHVAVTKTGYDFTLLVDGVAVVTSTVPGSYDGGDHHFQIGARMPEASDAFVGSIDEVRVWNVARTAVQIAADMRQPIARSRAERASLIGSWRFDDMAGTIAADEQGSHDGAVLGATWVSATAY